MKVTCLSLPDRLEHPRNRHHRHYFDSAMFLKEPPCWKSRTNRYLGKRRLHKSAVIFLRTAAHICLTICLFTEIYRLFISFDFRALITGYFSEAPHFNQDAPWSYKCHSVPFIFYFFAQQSVYIRSEKQRIEFHLGPSGLCVLLSVYG